MYDATFVQVKYFLNCIFPSKLRIRKKEEGEEVFH